MSKLQERKRLICSQKSKIKNKGLNKIFKIQMIILQIKRLNSLRTVKETLKVRCSFFQSLLFTNEKIVTKSKFGIIKCCNH